MKKYFVNLCAQHDIRFSEGYPPVLGVIGDSGPGRDACIQDWARALLCSDAAARPQSPAYCGECVNCRLHQEGQHPDCIAPPIVEKGKRLSVAAVRHWLQAGALAPILAARRVAWLPHLDDASAGVYQALLKAFEEPCGRLHYVYGVQSLEHIPLTLQSRTRFLQAPQSLPPAAYASSTCAAACLGFLQGKQTCDHWLDTLFTDASGTCVLSHASCIALAQHRISHLLQTCAVLPGQKPASAVREHAQAWMPVAEFLMQRYTMSALSVWHHGWLGALRQIRWQPGSQARGLQRYWWTVLKTHVPVLET